jgi:hypothetical protein
MAVRIAAPLALGDYDGAQDGRGEGLARIMVDIADVQPTVADATGRGLRTSGDAVEIGGVWFDLRTISERGAGIAKRRQ